MLTDFHSHILPGMDDGSDSMEETLAMLRLEAAQGITHVIATPHFYPRHDAPERFLERRAHAEQQLHAALAAEAGLPRVSVGAEVCFFPGMSQWEMLPQLTVGEGNCILIEMPPPPWSDGDYRELERIWQYRGLIPIVAHIDRYIRPFRSYGMLRQLSELPVLVQANADFFLTRATASMAMGLLKADQIHLLGSDCHNMTDRKPNLAPALQRIERKLGEAVISRIQRYEDTVLLPVAKRNGVRE